MDNVGGGERGRGAREEAEKVTRGTRGREKGHGETGPEGRRGAGHRAPGTGHRAGGVGTGGGGRTGDLQSRDMPTKRHFLKRQYWQRLRFSRITRHFPSRKQRYSICFWMLRRKKPCGTRAARSDPGSRDHPVLRRSFLKSTVVIQLENSFEKSSK